MSPERERARLMRRATQASVAVALLLIGLKLWAYLVTGAVSVLAGLIDSSLDAVASVLNLLAVRTALLPADREHRFGHGKAEAIAGLAQSLFIALSAVLLALESVRGLSDPRPVEAPAVGAVVSAVSIVVTMALVKYQAYVLRRSESVAIAADSLHYRGDLMLNLGIIASLGGQEFLGWHLLDPIFGVGVALFILWSAWGLFAESYQMLMDRELPDAARERIRAIVLADPQVLGVHALKTRGAGASTFIQLHVELDGALTLAGAHAIADAAEKRLAAAFPGAEVIIHQDPRPAAPARQEVAP